MSHAHQDERTSSDEVPRRVVPTANDVFTIRERLDIAAAARLLRDMQLRYLLVTDHGGALPRQQLIGVLTEHDIVATVAREADPRSVLVGDIMTRLVPAVPLERALAALPEAPPRNVVRINTSYAHLHGLLSSLREPQRMVERLRNLARAPRRAAAVHAGDES